MAIQGTLTLDTAPMQRALAEAKRALDAFGADSSKIGQQVSKLATALDGNKIVQQAHAATAAIQGIGGATALTDKEAKRHLATIDEARAKYRALGQEVPDSLNRISRELNEVSNHSKSGTGFLSQMAGTFAGFVSAQAVIAGVSSAFKATIGAAVDMNASLEKTTLQFTTLMGDADQARAHVAGLFEFAKRTPFETGPIIEASKYLRVFGGDALDTKENLKLIGDAAAATGAPINDLGMWVGRLYANLAAGKPIGEAAQRLTELAVIGPQARTALEQVAASGKSIEEKFAVAQAALGKFSGAMEAQAGTWEGVMSTFRDTAKMAVADALRPLFEAARDALASLNNLAASNTFESWAEVVGGAVEWLADRLRELPAAFVGVTGIFQTVKVAALQFARDFAEIGAKVNDTVARMMAPFTSLPGATGQMAGTIFGKASKEAADAKVAVVALDAILEASQSDLASTQLKAIALAAGLDDTKKAASGAAGATGQLGASLDTLSGKYDGASRKAREFNDALAKQTGWLASFPGGQWQPPTGGWNGGGGYLNTVGNLTNQWGSVWSPYGMGNALGYNGFRPTQSGGFNWSGVGLSGVNAAMPFISQALGGGQSAGIGGSIGGSVGGILGSSSMFGGLSGLGGFAGVLGSVAPFLGPIMGVVGSLIGRLFGPSEGRITSQNRAAWIAGMGGNEAFNQQFRDAQIRPDEAARLTNQLMSADTAKELEAAQRAISDAIARNNALLAEQRDIESQIKTIEEQRKALAESLIPTWEQVSGLLDKYGISLESAGQQAQQLMTTASMTTLINDMETLIRAGVDVGGMLAGMADEISKVVQQSIKFGTTIPENMKPYIEELIRSGKLLDENGNAITDLSNIKWGAPVETEAEKVTKAIEELDKAMQSLVDRLNEIIDKLANGIPAAADRASQSRVTVDYEERRPDGGDGYEVAMASGGIVTRPTVALIGESGPEAVVPLTRGRMSATQVIQIQVGSKVLAEVVLDEFGRQARAGRRIA